MEKLKQSHQVSFQKNSSFSPVIGSLFFEKEYNITSNNLEIITHLLAEKKTSDLQTAKNQFYQILKGKSEIAKLNLEISNTYLLRVDSADSDVKREVDQLQVTVKSFESAINKYKESEEGAQDQDTKGLLEQLQQVKDGQIAGLIAQFASFETAKFDYERTYHHFMNEEKSEALTTFRENLLLFLASNMVIPEHRNRYQIEQMQRFHKSLAQFYIKSPNMTLGEFSVRYGKFIEGHIAESHYYKNPHIEANYDDFQEKTIRPINATVFYYFFRLSKVNRKLAQFLLATIRYPNERVRRAYMRAFG